MAKELSIIICAYNSADHIKRAITSLLAETTPVKIIVIDDGSTDDTKKIVMELIEDHPDIAYYYKENGGVASARNFGMSKVDTPYFGFLDADDTVDSDMARMMLAKAHALDADVVFSDFKWIYPNKTVYQKDTGYKDTKEMITKASVVLWNKIYRTSFINELGLSFNDGLRYEDVAFSYELFAHLHKVGYVEKAFVDYYQNEGSLSRFYGEEVGDMIEELKLVKAYYKDHGLLDEYHDEIEYIHVRFFLGNSYLRTIRIKDRKLRQSILKRAWEYLTSEYPNYKRNPYLKKGLKNYYYRHVNEWLYYNSGWIFRLLYRMKIMR